MLACKDLSVVIQPSGTCILDRATAQFMPKALNAVIGPSGCGKSTFLRCINRMNDVIEGCRITGKITLNNEDIYDKGLDVV